MATLIERVRAVVRAFVLGSAVVEVAEQSFGHDPSTFSPPEYGDYIATSNGVYACVRLRSSLLASLPIRQYRVRANGDRTAVAASPVLGLLSKVNPFWTFQRLVEMTEMSLCLWGSAYWFVERGKSGTMAPSEIWWGQPDRVRVLPHPTKYISGFLYDGPGGAEIPFSASEVIWLRYPNPVDEYAGLAPLSAARLAADYSSAAMKSNRNLFTNGIQAGGMVFPKAGTMLSPEQAQEIEIGLQRRFQGVDRAHRWGVFRAELEMKPLGMSPRDAEFVAGLRLALEDIARAYAVPLDLIGGQRTYENVSAAMRAVWTNCLQPEARFVATELTEQLLPMFGAQADVLEFDTDGVEELQESRGLAWTRAREQIEVGVMTRNEWRQEQGKKTVPWGDAWWASQTLVPIMDAEPPEPPAPPEPVVPPAAPTPDANALLDAEDPAPRQATPAHRRIAYGTAQHVQRWQRFTEASAPWEKRFTSEMRGLFDRQQASILAHVTGRGARQLDPSNPFDRARWIREFRQAVRTLLRDVAQEGGQMALDDVRDAMEFAIEFNLSAPAVIRFLEERAQRFAVQVNETTWEALKASLSEGMQAGETIEGLAQRVEEIMTERRSSSETIARTEVIGAMNGGSLEGWSQSGVVVGKSWLAALDDLVRDTHRAAHGQVVGIDDNFSVGDGHGPHPGAIGIAAEDINCRCSMVPVLDVEGLP